jgi:AcrR family transcriptional regulator
VSTETGRDRPRKDQQRNRAALIAAACDVFAEQGIDAPLDTVAKRAELNNATLYRHFPERRDIIVEVLRVNLARSELALTEALERPTGWEGLCAYLQWVFADLIDSPAQLSAMRAVPIGQHPETDRLRYKTTGMLEMLVQKAKQERLLRADRWIEDIYLLLSANEQIAHAGHSDPHAASQRLLELALASLRTTREPESAVETPAVLRLRAAIGNDLAGLPRAPTGESTSRR